MRSTTKSQSIPASLRCIAVALVFAGCGWLSAAYLLNKDFPGKFEFMLPMPFAILCALLFMRTWKLIFAVPLMVIVWIQAYTAAWVLGHMSILALGSGCIGGLIGGLGVALSAMACCERLRSPLLLFYLGAIGCFSGLSFVPWLWSFLSNLNSPPPPSPRLAFAIWQAAVGTYLYAICTHANKREEQSEASNVETVAEP